MAIAGLAATLVGVGTMMGACSNQPEGSRCDVNAGGTPPGTDDCQEGLVCTSPSDLFWPSVGDASAQRASTYICCPGDRTQAITDICKIKTSPIQPTDASTDGGSATDAQADAADSGAADSGAADSGSADAASE